MEPKNLFNIAALKELLNLSPVLNKDVNYHKISIAPMLVYLFPHIFLYIYKFSQIGHHEFAF